MKNDKSASDGTSLKWVAQVATVHPRRKNAYGMAIGAVVGLCIVGVMFAFSESGSKPSQILASFKAGYSNGAVNPQVILISNAIDIRVLAVIPLPYHNKFFADTPPIAANISGVAQVVDGQFFCGKTPPTLKIGELVFELERDPKTDDGKPYERNGQSQFKITDSKIESVKAAIASGIAIELEYCDVEHGAGYISRFERSR
jgi:hypothetical protein